MSLLTPSLRSGAGLLLALVILGTISARATLFSDVTVTGFSSQYGVDGGDMRWARYTTDGNRTNTNPSGVAWLDNFTPTGTITWSLGGAQKLDSIDVWNYNEATAGLTTRGASNVVVSYSADYGATFTSLGNFVVAKAPGTAAITPTTINTGGITATDVRFDVTGNYGDSAMGLNEVDFNGTVRQPSFRLNSATVTGWSSQFTGREATKTLDGIIYTKDGNVGMWLSNGADNTPTITFNVSPGAVRLDHLLVWNYNEQFGLTSRGLNTIQVQISTNGVDFSPGLNAQDGSTTFTLSEGTGDWGVVPTPLFLQGQPLATYVRLVTLTNPNGDGYAGLTEVQFFQAIPEPSVAVLLALGGLILRRSRRNGEWGMVPES